MSVKTKYGHMSCPACQAAGRPENKVLVRISDKGGLSYLCDECDAPTQYAPAGTGLARDWEKRITKIAPTGAPPAQKKEEKKDDDKKTGEPKPAKTYPWQK